MSGSLQHKYRPTTFDEMVGNKGAVASLKSVLDRKLKDIPRAFLFTGPSGCGKTTLARIIQNVLGVSDMDFFEYDAANTNGIATIREIRSVVGNSPMDGSTKIYFLDECHELTGPAQEALLKILEKPTKHVVIILATTDPQKLKKTLKGRCHTYEVSANPSPVVRKYLLSICDKEDVDVSDKVIDAIIKAAEGAMRDAVKLLDMVIDIEDDDVAIEAINNASVNESTVIELCRAMCAKGSAASKWKECKAILSTIEGDSEKIRRVILGYFSKYLLGNGGDRESAILDLFLDNTYDSGMPKIVANVYLACKV